MIRNQFRQRVATDAGSGESAAGRIGEADPELHLFTTMLRRRFLRHLTEALRKSDHVRLPPHTGEQKTILGKLYQAVHGGPQSLKFRYEVTTPLSEQYTRAEFHEALISLVDSDGNVIPSQDLLDALDNKDFNEEVGMYFRLWLIFAQLRDFCRYDKNKRLSVNILPQDTDQPAFRAYLAQGINIARRNGYNNLILEAVENRFWTTNRREFLKSLLDSGITIAIDDYGAPEGHNQAETLALFNRGKSPGNLIIKLDGVLVRNFIDKGDQTLIRKLEEIKEHCPFALVVAEWVNSAEDARELRARLEPFGMDQYIHLVQSREIHDPDWLFLEKLKKDRPRPDAGQASQPALRPLW